METEELKTKLRALSTVNERGCWIWTGRTDEKGYGHLGNNRAHRLAFKLWKGDIPNGLCVCHECDTPPCINPDHLWLGTNLDNTLDKMAKGRYVNNNMMKTHCPKGHPLSGPNLLKHSKRGYRNCRTCFNAARREKRRQGDKIPKSTKGIPKQYLTQEHVDYIRLSTKSAAQIAKELGFSVSAIARARKRQLTIAFIATLESEAAND